VTLYTITYAGKGYELVRSNSANEPGIRCKTCGKVSYQPQDIANKYCGQCHKFHEESER
jgi:hypothetical protein